jgi:1-acyl-sn-glycerol-3-phosphate acyltransferase
MSMYSLDILLLAALETAKVSVPTVYERALNLVDPETCDARLGSWAAHLLAQAKVTVNTIGREHIVPGESYVVISNHQSHYDIPAAFAAFGPKLRMIAKTELFRIPLMGGAMEASGFIELDRHNQRRALASLSVARERIISNNTSIWVAPEGTRSKTGQLGPFKKGGFHLALNASLRILPMAIDGTRRVHAPGARRVKKGQTVQVTFGCPVDPVAFGKEGLGQLVTQVRAEIAKHLPAEQAG